jgi:hypothetical protein
MFDNSLKTQMIMRSIKQFLLLLSAACFISSCEKTEEIINTEDQVGHSRITFFPILTVKGDKYLPISVGGTFTDPGVEATEGGNAITATTAGTVDVNTPGVYTLTYTAVNKDGFSVSDTRNVIVYSTETSAAGNDFSGTYLRAATGETSTWTKIAPGVYTVLNPGGAAAGRSLMVVAINPTGYAIEIPEQTGSDGNTSASSDEVYTPGSPATYTWRYLNPGANYGTGLRIFVKQ